MAAGNPSIEESTFGLTTKSIAVNIAAADHDLTLTFPNGARRLYVGTGGTVVATKAGDAGAMTYLNVPSGSYLDGQWITVVKVGTTAAAMIAEH